MNRFCPVCGKTVSLEDIKKYDGTCKTCYYKNHPLFTMEKKSLFIQICPQCLKYRNIEESDKAWYIPERKEYKDVWFQAIHHFLISKIKGSDALDFFIDPTHEPSVIDSGKKKIVWLELTGRSRPEGTEGEEPREEIVKIQLKYSVGTCNDCAQKHVGYHNSLIQLRSGMKRVENEQRIADLKQDILDFASRSDFHGTNQITSVEDVSGGVDIKLMSKQLGKNITNYVRKKYCVDVKESFKIAGPDKETGGNLTRTFYGIRLYSFVPGDVLLFEKKGEPCMILRVTSAMAHLVSLVTGRIEHAKPDTFTEEDLIFQVNKDDPIEFQVVSLNEQDATMNLMRTDTYEERVENFKEWLGIEQEEDIIKGFFFADKLYLFPLAQVVDHDKGGAEPDDEVPGREDHARDAESDDVDTGEQDDEDDGDDDAGE
nr:NMD3-related protein [Candidatus Sigynarchaeota archaeon]